MTAPLTFRPLPSALCLLPSVLYDPTGANTRKAARNPGLSKLWASRVTKSLCQTNRGL